jgi:hypothetical protein
MKDDIGDPLDMENVSYKKNSTAPKSVSSLTPVPTFDAPTGGAGGAWDILSR